MRSGLLAVHQMLLASKESYKKADRLVHEGGAPVAHLRHPCRVVCAVFASWDPDYGAVRINHSLQLFTSWRGAVRTTETSAFST